MLSHAESALLSRHALGMITAVKAPILSFAIVLTLSLDAVNAASAATATWNANPVDSHWSNRANWTPARVPNGPSDTAMFASSGVTDVSIRCLRWRLLAPNFLTGL